MPRRWWTSAEVQHLFELLTLGKTVKQAARILGRSYVMCIRYARKRKTKKPIPRLELYEGKVRTLYAQGLDGTGIARKLGLKPCTVRAWLRRMGLKPLGLASVRAKQWLDKKWHRQVQDGTAPHQTAQAKRAVEAARLGWPGADTPLQARALSVLRSKGEQTAVSIAKRLGVNGRTVQWVMLCLVRRGFVLCRRLPGKGGPLGYRLAQGVDRSEYIGATG